MWYIIECSSVVKTSEMWIRAMTWMNHKNLMLSERSQMHTHVRARTHTTLIIQFYLYEMSKIGISIETESR